MKQCSKCRQDLALDLFVKGAGKDGLNPWCRPCRTESVRERRKNNPDKPKRPTRSRNSALLYNYGITADQFDELLKKQNGECATCDKKAAESSKPFEVDHNHACCPGPKTCGNCIRGILCHRCNVVLGWVGDNGGVLRSLAHYADKFA